MTSRDRSLSDRISGARPAAALLALSLLVVGGCVNGQAGGNSQQPSASPSGVPTAEPSTGGGFYLRAWQTQALAPRYTFTWLPVATIAGGQLIEGQVAVPAIYPGPLWIGPQVRSISNKGVDIIVAEARAQGLLGEKRNFAEEMLPGSISGHIAMIVDGTKYDLSGDPSALTRCRCIPEPGTSGAFAAFWQRLSGIPGWLGAEVGESSPYEPDRLAVMTMAPVEAADGITPNEVDWPLDKPLDAFGMTYGSAYRCGVVSGADLGKLLPVVKQANQLTRFVDATGTKRSLLVRVVLPGETSPCGS
jgi:hypothetical protein